VIPFPTPTGSAPIPTRPTMLEIKQRFEIIRAAQVPAMTALEKRLWLEALLLSVLAVGAVTLALWMPSTAGSATAGQDESSVIQPGDRLAQAGWLPAVALKVPTVSTLVARPDVPAHSVPTLLPAAPAAAAGADESAVPSRVPADVTMPQASTYAVQVAAPDNRAEADAIAHRLTSKGYEAFVQAASTANSDALRFRVRVGPFSTRPEAEAASARLRTDRLDPFVLRNVPDARQPK